METYCARSYTREALRAGKSHSDSDEDRTPQREHIGDWSNSEANGWLAFWLGNTTLSDGSYYT
jgi:hypothetical protein